MGRPEFDAIVPTSVLTIADNPVIGSIGTLSIGNPDLEARASSNLDMSLEWYFDEGALLSAAVFRKDITNEIIRAPTERLTEPHVPGADVQPLRHQHHHQRGGRLRPGHRADVCATASFLPGPLDGLGWPGRCTFID